MKDNISQVIVLEMKDFVGSINPYVCIANVHMFWDPEYRDVKLWQCWTLIKELEKFTLHRNLPLVLCGDFNSMPDSAVYEFLCSNKVRDSMALYISLCFVSRIMKYSSFSCFK